jgi:hypothetical protein
MGVKKMGFEGKLYYGVAGSTASTELTNSRDITISTDPERGETTIRGAGTSPPLKTERVTAIALSIDFAMLNDPTDSSLTALRTAAAAGSPVALRGKDYSSGKGLDGDFTLSEKLGKPYKGEQTFDFTATPTNESGREPQAYV